MASAPYHIHFSLVVITNGAEVSRFSNCNLLCVRPFGCCSLMASAPYHVHASLVVITDSAQVSYQGFPISSCSVWDLLGVASSWHQHRITFMPHCGDHWVEIGKPWYDICALSVITTVRHECDRVLMPWARNTQKVSHRSWYQSTHFCFRDDDAPTLGPGSRK